MRILRDFVCTACNAAQERYVDTDNATVPCLHCGGTAYRVIGMPRVVLEGITGAFPGAHSRWADVREKHARLKAEKKVRHGE